MTSTLAMSLLTGAAVMSAGAYLLGSVPFGYLIGRAKGLDIRKAGSGNIGSSNVGRLLGRRYFLICFCLDFAKGLAPVVVLGRLLGGGIIDRGGSPAWANVAWLGVGTAALLGHVFPVFLRFKGGKGVATALGVVLGIYPHYTLPGLGAFAVWCIVVAIWRYISLGSLLGACGFVLFYILSVRYYWREPMSDHWPLLVFAVLVASLIMVRHRDNVRRLLQGRESKIGRRVEAHGSASPADD